MLGNRVDFTGRLTKDAKIETTKSGVKYTKFTLALDDPSHKGRADFAYLTAFNKTADIIATYAGKGRMIQVTGHVHSSTFKKQDGQTGYSQDMIIDQVLLLGSRNKASQNKQADQDAAIDDAAQSVQDIDQDVVPF